MRNNIKEDTKFKDVLKIDQMVYEKLNEVSSRSEAKRIIVFINTEDYPDACGIIARESVTKDLIPFTGTLLWVHRKRS